jgi:hypothetical protein
VVKRSGVANRVGGVGGCGYVLLTLVGLLCLERFGAGGAITSWSAGHLARFFHQHRTEMRLAAMFFSVAILPYLVFLARLRDVLDAAESDDALTRLASSVLWAGSIAGAVVPFVFATFMWGFAYRPGATSPAVTQLSYDLCLLTGPGGADAIWAAMLGAIGYLALKDGRLPRWLGIFALISCASQGLYLGNGFVYHGFFDGNPSLTSWTEGLSAILCYGSYLVWILAVSVTWLVGTSPGERALPATMAPVPREAVDSGV